MRAWPIQRFSLPVALLGLGLCWHAVGAASEGIKTAANSPDAYDQIAQFENLIRPLLAENCFVCHGEDIQEAELRVDQPQQLFDATRTPPLIAPGDPDGSRLIQLVRGTRELRMPPDDPLPPESIKVLEAWVAQGAYWPAYDAEAIRADASKSKHLAASFTEEEQNFWAFQPVSNPPVPETGDDPWPTNGIDRFLLATLASKGLSPSKIADKRTLMRRLTYDLTGLPPTPEEMAAFLADNSPDAYERTVDRLLDSPRYGEHWGRRWLDVVRFAESGGHDGNEAYLHAWRYRDYVIRSFNDDKPYNRFIIEQLAGDLLPSTGDPQKDFDQIVATGFLEVGPKPSVMRDKQQMMLDITDEIVNATGVAFMGLTLGCARCHDHKFDPIPTSDYYSLAGIFMSTEVMADTEVNSKWLEYEVPTGKSGLVAKVMAVRDRAEPTNLRIHLRGSYHTLGAEAPRRFLQIIAGHDVPTLKGSGRLELAQWLASDEHPLTARVMVNRIWQHHFGRGLVATSGNFGRMGTPPTHPQLLDWLARRFVESGWSVKSMHRLIVLSSAYRQAGDVNSACQAADPENELLWRRRPKRLSAEELRDSMLAVSGRLDTTMGGTLFTEGYSAIDAKRDLYAVDISQTGPVYKPFEAPRRSVYLPVIRNARPEVLKLFDVANEHEPSSVRSETTIPSQALYLLNSPFVAETAASLAERVLRDVGPFLLDSKSSSRQMLERLYQVTFCRDPSDAERNSASDFLEKYASRVAAMPAKPEEKAAWDVRQNRPSTTVPAPDLPQFLAWQALCRALLCSNEFMYVQ